MRTKDPDPYGLYTPEQLRTLSKQELSAYLEGLYVLHDRLVQQNIKLDNPCSRCTRGPSVGRRSPSG